MAVTNNAPYAPAPGTNPSSPTVTAADLQNLQSKYATDQAQVAAGKMDASQLTSDWNDYLAAAQAWQTGSASGNATNTILPINEPGVSGPSVSDFSKRATTSGPAVSEPSGSVATISAPTTSGGSVGGVPSYIAGSPTLDPSFRNGPYKAYADAIEAAAKATGVSANLLGAMLADESRGQYTGMQDPLQAGGTGTMPENVLAGAKHLIDDANASAAKFGTGSLGVALRTYNSGLLNTNPNDLHSIQNPGQAKPTGVTYYVDQVTSNLNLLNNGQGANLPT